MEVDTAVQGRPMNVSKDAQSLWPPSARPWIAVFTNGWLRLMVHLAQGGHLWGTLSLRGCGGMGGEVISLLLEYYIWSRLRPLRWNAYRQLAMWSMGKKLSPRESILRIITKVISEHGQEGTTLGWAFLCQLVTNKMTYRHVQMPNWWAQFLN